jgi:excisionase family DNA binding protein
MNNTKEWPEWLTVREAAAILRVAPMTMYRRIHEGHVTAKRFGRNIRIQDTELRAYIENSSEPVQGDAVPATA